jgi:peptidyl-prolyl cis-trans isomerase A (cyclophilin A)
MRRRLSVQWLVISLFVLSACNRTPEEPETVVEPQQTSTASPTGSAPPARAPSAALLSPPAADERAPDEFTVVVETTKGEIEMRVHRAWSPKGADRFYTLVRLGYYDDVAFFRVVEGFMAQIGIHGNGQVNAAWRMNRIEDDPAAGQSNTRGRVSFATSGPNSRTTQFFINFGNNANLDSMGFTPFAEVTSMDVVDRLYAGYGEGAPGGRGPSQGRLQSEGNTYLRSEFPQLDYIRTARIRQ